MFITSKLVSLFLRFSSLLSKFFLLVYVSKELSPNIVGQYSIFTTSVLLSIFIVGADFYTYSTRKIVNSKSKNEIKVEVVHQFIFYLISYVVFLSISIPFLNITGIINNEHYLLFFAIVIFEHLSQEIFRLFNTINRVEIANLILFIRAGSWIILIIIFNELAIINITLKTLYSYWLFFSALSVVIGIVILNSLIKVDEKVQFKISLRKIGIGFRTSSVFFIGTILYKIVEYSNRYFIDYKLGDTQTGIYSFYSNISNVLVVFIDVVIFSYSYPKIIEAINNRVIDTQKLIGKLFLKILLLSVLVSLGLFIGTISIFRMYSHFAVYSEELYVLPILLLGSILLNLSLLYHYGVYALEKDSLLLYSMIVTCFINISSNYYLVPLIGIQGAAWSQVVSFLFLFVIKYYFYKSNLNNDY